MSSLRLRPPGLGPHIDPSDSSTHRRALIAGAAGLCAAPGLAWAQPQSQTGTPIPPPEPPPGSPIDDSGALAGKRDRTRRLTTSVFINGQGPFDMVIDTGANRTVISAELAARLALPPGNPARVHGIAGVQETQTVNIAKFQASVISLPLHDVPILPDADLGTHGLLGIDVFRSRRVIFDFQRNTVRLDRSHRGEVTGSRLDVETAPVTSVGAVLTSDITVHAVQKSGQLTIVDADAARTHINCFIDSGAQLSVGNMAMRKAIKARTHDIGHEPIPVIIHGATGQSVRGEVAFVPTMRLGGVNFTSFNMAFADLHTFELWGLQDTPCLMMGMDLLTIFQLVAVDFGGRNVTFRIAEIMTPDHANA